MKLSVIVITCGQALAVRDMLSKCVGYNIPNNVEIIVADDYSNDPNLPALEEFLSSFENTSLVFAPKKLFTGGIRNFSIQYAKGDWIWFVDGDDEIIPSSFSRILSAIETAKTDCLVIDYIVNKPSGREPVTFHAKNDPGLNLKIWNVGVMAWSKIIKRDSFALFRSARSEDNDWWVRQCILLTKKTCHEDFDTVPGGPCLVYNALTPGSFTAALERFRSAKGVAEAAHVLMTDDETASAVADSLVTVAQLIRLSKTAKECKMPDTFIAHHEWSIRWWLGSFFHANHL